MTLAEESVSSIPRRILGLALLAARQRAGLTMVKAAEASAMSEQTVRRIERGEVLAQPGRVIMLCTAYNVPDHTRDALVGLAKEGKSRGWWHSYGDMIPNWFEVYMTLEQTASNIRIYGPLLVPGLLQHSDYMDLVIRTDLPELRADQVAARIELRRSRQQLLIRPFPEPPKVKAIIAEAALLVEPPVPDVLRLQVWHLLKAAELPSVEIRVLPVQVGPHRGSVTGAWTLLDFPSQNGSTPPPSTVYSESVTGALYLDKPSEVEIYNDIWASLEAAALDPTETIGNLAHRLKELTDGA